MFGGLNFKELQPIVKDAIERITKSVQDIDAAMKAMSESLDRLVALNEEIRDLLKAQSRSSAVTRKV